MSLETVLDTYVYHFQSLYHQACSENIALCPMRYNLREKIFMKYSLLVEYFPFSRIHQKMRINWNIMNLVSKMPMNAAWIWNLSQI